MAITQDEGTKFFMEVLKFLRRDGYILYKRIEEVDSFGVVMDSFDQPVKESDLTLAVWKAVTNKHLIQNQGNK